MDELDLRLLDEVGALVVVLDEEGRIVHWNEACSRLTGYELEEVRDRHVWDFLLTDDEAEAVEEEFRRAKRADPVSTFENYWLTKEGEERWISWSNSTMTDDGETYLVSTGIDRTKAKRAHEALRASEAKLRHILDLAPDAIVVVDEDQEIVIYNDGAERMFGWERTEVLGKPLEILLPERFRDAHREHVRRFAEEERQARAMGDATTEIRGLRRNGREFPADAAISKVELDDGMLFTVILRDLTERKNLEESLRRQIEQRDELMRRIVHDLRNPLNTIALQSQLLERIEPDSTERLHESLEQIREASDMMERLLEDLLDTASAQTGNLTVRTTPTDLSTVVADAVSRHFPRAKREGIELYEEVPESLPDVEADRIRLMQVFDNLLGNALKFTPEAGEIWVEAEPNGSEVAVEVNDTGPGLAPDEREHIFEPFWQADSDDRRGVGLGLAIVEAVIESHHGEIRAESTPGDGTTFRFTLPVCD